MSNNLAGAIQSKFWGETQCIFKGNYSETHFLNIESGGFCSTHLHNNKWNRFFLISGKIEVVITRLGGDDVTVLLPGHFTDVPPKTQHFFRALEDSKCLEVYWVDDICEDIVRYSSGGNNFFDPKNHEQSK